MWESPSNRPLSWLLPQADRLPREGALDWLDELCGEPGAGPLLGSVGGLGEGLGLGLGAWGWVGGEDGGGE